MPICGCRAPKPVLMEMETLVIAPGHPMAPYMCVYCGGVAFRACRFMEKSTAHELACGHVCCQACAEPRTTKKQRVCAFPGCGKVWTKAVFDPFFSAYSAGSEFEVLLWNSNKHARRQMFAHLRESAAAVFRDAVHPLYWGDLERDMVERGMRVHTERPFCPACGLLCLDNGHFWTCPLVNNRTVSVMTGHYHGLKPIMA
jgi:hypothetical protein